MTTKSTNADTGDIICEHCGFNYHYDHQRHCYSCDGPGCPQCLGPDAYPICPECRPSPLPSRVEPMLAALGEMPGDLENYAAELKWDGLRALFFCNGRSLRIQSRNLIDITDQYPEFHDLPKSVNCQNVVLDGEIVALDNKGKPSFELLQKRMHRTRPGAVYRPGVYYFIFDAIFLNGIWRNQLSYQQRRALLDKLNLSHKNCRLTDSYPGRAKDLLQAARRFELEGIICKKLTSTYEQAARSTNWTKIKIVKSREFVIGGYLPQRESKDRIGALLLGYYSDASGYLQYAGKVGSGFSADTSAALLEKLSQLAIPQSPFATKVPDQKIARFTRGVLIAHVEYRRWPARALLQQSVFKGLRFDKNPQDVRIENHNHNE